MKVKLGNHFLISVAFFILTIAGSQIIVSMGIDLVAETAGCLLLITALVRNAIKLRRRGLSQKIGAIGLVVLFCFVIGILLQHVTMRRRLILLFTMIVLWLSVFFSRGMIVSLADVRHLSFVVLGGIIVTFIATVIICPTSLFDDAGRMFGLKFFGFSAGVRYKNYFAADMLVVFGGLYLFRKYEKKYLIDLFCEIIAVIMIVISGSKGGYLLLAIFWISVNTEKIRRLSRNHRKMIFACAAIIAAGIGVLMFYGVALKSKTYLLRFNGLLNFIEYYRHDTFHMCFGIAESVYDQDMSYVMKVRSITGWNGSLEFSWLDILIKNGIIGVIGFALVFIRYFRGAVRERNWGKKGIILGYLLALLASSLVEIYIQSIHSIYGLLSYLILTGFLTDQRQTSLVSNAET